MAGTLQQCQIDPFPHLVYCNYNQEYIHVYVYIIQPFIYDILRSYHDLGNVLLLTSHNRVATTTVNVTTNVTTPNVTTLNVTATTTSVKYFLGIKRSFIIVRVITLCYNYSY